MSFGSVIIVSIVILAIIIPILFYDADTKRVNIHISPLLQHMRTVFSRFTHSPTLHRLSEHADDQQKDTSHDDATASTTHQHNRDEAKLRSSHSQLSKASPERITKSQPVKTKLFGVFPIHTAVKKTEEGSSHTENTKPGIHFSLKRERKEYIPVRQYRKQHQRTAADDLRDLERKHTSELEHDPSMPWVRTTIGDTVLLSRKNSSHSEPHDSEAKTHDIVNSDSSTQVYSDSTSHLRSQSKLASNVHFSSDEQQESASISAHEVAYSTDNDDYDDELSIDDELSQIQSVKASDYVANSKPVTEIPELEVLEPIYFGSATVLEENSLHSTSLTDRKDHSDFSEDAHHDDEQEYYYAEDTDASHDEDIHYEDENYDEEEFHHELDGDELHDTETEDTYVSQAQPTPSFVFNTQLPAITRQHRGGYDPETDARISAAKYRVRQTNVAILAMMAVIGLLTAIFVDLGKIQSIVTCVLVFPILFYLAYLRHTVRLEQNIRDKRHQRYLEHHQIDNSSGVDSPRHTSRLVPVDIDDEDPIFDHLDEHPLLETIGEYEEEKHAVAV